MKKKVRFPKSYVLRVLAMVLIAAALVIPQTAVFAAQEQTGAKEFVVDTNKKKIHLPGCSKLSGTRAKDKAEVIGDIDSVKAIYPLCSFCRVCSPQRATATKISKAGIKTQPKKISLVKKNGRPVKKVSIIMKTKLTYIGSPLTPKVKVKYGKKTLKQGKDYTVTYRNNRKAGTAKAIMKGKGKYKGTIVKKFKIVSEAKKKQKQAVSVVHRWERYYVQEEIGSYQNVPIKETHSVCNGCGQYLDVLYYDAEHHRLDVSGVASHLYVCRPGSYRNKTIIVGYEYKWVPRLKKVARFHCRACGLDVDVDIYLNKYANRPGNEYVSERTG